MFGEMERAGLEPASANGMWAIDSPCSLALPPKVFPGV
jgi:hypothetical protein